MEVDFAGSTDQPPSRDRLILQDPHCAADGTDEPRGADFGLDLSLTGRSDTVTEMARELHGVDLVVAPDESHHERPCSGDEWDRFDQCCGVYSKRTRHLFDGLHSGRLRLHRLR